MIGKIRSVTGDIDASKIKGTMIHEHIVFDISKIRGDNVSVLGGMDTISAIEAELKKLKGYGINSIVEQTNMGMGRNPLLLNEISSNTGVFIIAGTGYYKEGFYPDEVFKMSEREIADKLTQEILNGIEGTEVKAGLYGEIGSSHREIKTIEEKVFNAVIISHKETGAPISTHCELGTMGTEQMKIFDREVIAPEKVSFGHQDLNTDSQSQLQLLKWGAYVQFDTIGKVNYRADEDRMNNLLRLLDKGYEDKIMLSCDITRKTYLKAFGGYGYTNLYENFITKLVKLNLGQSIIDKLLIENPKKFLAF